MIGNRFQSSDAWIFLSLGNDEAGSTLRDIIATADWINHAIPTKQEIEGAINRLSVAGLVKVEDDKFMLTSEGKTIYEKMVGQHRQLLKIWPKLEKYLNTTDFPTLRVKTFKLKRGQLERVYKNYIQDFAENS